LSYAARAFLFGVPPLGVTTVVVVAAALGVVVTVAAIVPLRRALSVNPNLALRAE
jgi:ABC-type antimicrobial peptide transport system permease subunit